MATSIEQVFNNARIDAISLEGFLNSPPETVVPRRLATPIKTLSYYENYMESLVKGKDATIEDITVTTVLPDVPASGSLSGTPNARVLNLSLPKGEKGDKGEEGQGGSYLKKAYKTYALMELDKANIPARTSVDVTNDPNLSRNGNYNYDGVIFTKSIYDSESFINNALDKAITQVVTSSGFIILDSFELGATITQRNQALRHTATGKIYRWAGNLPKVVATGSSPLTSGGLGVSGWMEVSDTTLRSEIASGSLVTDELIKTIPTYKGMVSRTQASKNAEHVSAMDFGALADGTGATVADWYTLGSANYRKYASLAAVQVDYPHVTSADDTIDWAACQAAVNSGAWRVYFPAGAGSYVFNRPVRTKHTNTYFRNDTGQQLYGDGFKSTFTRRDTTPPTRVQSTATNAEKLAADIANSDEACFAIHGSNNKISNIRVSSSKIGIYFGQDYSTTEDSSVCHNTIEFVQIAACGTGFMSACANGNHYNDYARLHIINCQIGMHLKAGGRWTSILSNNNRNTFFKLRAARCHVGLWIESGDTNSIYSFHGESCSVQPTGMPATLPAPDFLPEDMKTCVHIIGGQANRVFSSQFEACTRELYNYGYNNEYYGNGYRENVNDGEKVVLKTKPGIFISAFSLVNPFISMLSNTNPQAFPDTGFGLTLSGGATPVIVSNPQVVKTAPAFANKTSYTTHDKEIAGLAANTSTTTNVWSSTSRKGAVSIDIKIVAIDTVANQVLTCSAKIAAIRNTAGTITYYKIIPTGALSATGVDTGGVTELIGLSLSVTGKDLLLNIKAPTYQPLNTIAIRIERFYTEPAVVV